MKLDELISQVTHPEDLTSTFYPEDVKSNQLSGVLASFPILFWIPLVLAKESPYGKFCANQGLTLFVFYMVVGIAEGILGAILPHIPLIGSLLNWAVGLVGFVAVSAVFLLLLISACQGKARRIPLIGGMMEAFR